MLCLLVHLPLELANLVQGQAERVKMNDPNGGGRSGQAPASGGGGRAPVPPRGAVFRQIVADVADVIKRPSPVPPSCEITTGNPPFGGGKRN